MERRQKLFFYGSLWVITGYWIFNFATMGSGAPDLPDDTSKLLSRIALTKVAVFIVIYSLLLSQGDNLNTLGWKPARWGKQAFVGFLWGIVTFALINIALNPVMKTLFPQEVDTGPGIMAHFADPAYLWLWIVASLVGGGFVEELQRVFILTRFEKWLGSRFVIWILLLDAIVFGIGHLYQGMAGAVSTGLTGIIFGLIYLRKRSFIEAFAAHATFDIVGILIGHILMQQAMNT